MVIDGKPSSVYAEAGTPVFNPDSEHVAFWAGKGSHRSIERFIVLDGGQIAVDPLSMFIYASENLRKAIIDLSKLTP